MSLETLCLYNKYGYCKFSETCRKFHIKEICENQHCETKSCLKRHPRPCGYYQEYKRCKFGSFCSFSHKSEVNVPNELEELRNRFDTLENKMKEKDKEIEALIYEVAAIKKERSP